MKKVILLAAIIFSSHSFAQEENLFQFYCMKKNQEMDYKINSQSAYLLEQSVGRLSSHGALYLNKDNLAQLTKRVHALDLPNECTSFFLSREYWEENNSIARGHFNFDRSEVTNEGVKALSLLAQELDFTEQVHLVGHADALGSDEYNMILSQRRVKNAKKILEDLGHYASDTDYNGKREPVASNANDYGRAVNRRIEVFNVK
ncbi:MULTISPECIES: OmpA family protein [Vibrio]|nr:MULTISPECIES: OmpA family protein [Vibrio]MBE4579471.1 hypothetical protein [Vibrio navarrensis]MBN8105316.1 OmpA family protein [Vibrio vulnificus]